METIRSFEDMVIHLAQRGERKRVAIVWAADQYSQESVIRALEVGFIDAIFVGCRDEVESNKRIMRYQDHITFIDASDRDTAAKISVQMVREGKA
ncbi:MAG: phosphate butyryltransferase, partial [Prevotella sp.]|nr:phosphate butyryltransferase [Prevotella sp.]